MNDNVASYCSANVEHDMLKAQQHRDLRALKERERELVQMAQSAMERERLTCVEISPVDPEHSACGHDDDDQCEFIVIRNVASYKVTHETVVDALRSMANTKLDATALKKDKTWSGALRRQVSERIAKRRRSYIEENPRLVARVTSHRPREHTQSDQPDPSGAMMRVARELISVREARCSKQHEWKDRMMPHKNTLRRCADDVHTFLEGVANHRQNIKMRRRDDPSSDSADYVLHQSEKVSKVRIGVRQMLQAIERAALQEVNAMMIDDGGNALLDKEIIERIVTDFEAWFAAIPKQTVKKDVRLYKNKKV